MKTDEFRKADLRIDRALKAVRLTRSWPMFAEMVQAFLNMANGAEKFQLANMLSGELYLAADDTSLTDEKSSRAFDRLRKALTPDAQLCWPWYQKDQMR